MEKIECKEWVTGSLGGLFRCYRWATKDGYCWQHHPDAVKARQEKASARWEAKQQNSPLSRATRRIAELEAEIKELRAELHRGCKAERGGE